MGKYAWGNEKANGLVQKLKKLQKEMIDVYKRDGNEFHLYIDGANTKTHMVGISLLPVVDCHECKECRHFCYDLFNDLGRNPNLQKGRASNSAMHKLNPTRFWFEVRCYLAREMPFQVRMNVGGDYNFNDFVELWDIGKKFPTIEFILFTQSHKDLNKVTDLLGKPSSNVHLMWSAREGKDEPNRHGYYEAGIVHPNGVDTSKADAVECINDCSRCLRHKIGCGYHNVRFHNHCIDKAHKIVGFTKAV